MQNLPFRHVHWSLFGVLCLSIGAMPVRAQTNDLASHFQKANAAGERKDWDTALAELNAIIALDKNNANAYEGKSVVLLQKQDFKGALEALNKVIELDPKRATAYQTRASLHQKLGESDAAKADYLVVLQLSPEERNTVATEAQKATDAKDWKKAYSLWSLYAEAMPGEARANYESGVALTSTVSVLDYVMANPDQKALFDKVLTAANAHFDAALKADPKFVPAYLARIEKKVGTRSADEYKSALALLNQGIAQVPNSAPLYIARARLSEGFLASDEITKSHILDYTRALQYDSKSFPALLGRANAYHLSNQDSLGLIDINQALALKPDDVKALTTRAAIYESLHDWERAAADYGQAYSHDASNTPLAFSRYLALSHLPDTKKALDAISELIVKEPKNALYLRVRADLHFARKEYALALSDVDASLAIEPDNSSATQLRTQIVNAQKTK